MVAQSKTYSGGVNEIWGTMDTRPIHRVQFQSRKDKYRWEQLQRKFKAHCKMRNLLCHLCVRRGDLENAVIDYNAKPLTPNAFEADHIRPWSTHPNLRFEWANLAASHSRCNRQRRDDQLNLTAPQPDWVKPDW